MLFRLRLGILIATLACLALHFGMVGLHVNPFRAPEKPSFWGDWYCSPFFTQGWTLFAPVPDNNYMIFVDYELDGRKVRREIFRDLVLKHRTNRFAGLEPLVVAFANSIHFFEHTTEMQQALNGPVKDELYFDMLLHAVRRYEVNRCGGEPKNFRMILLVLPVDGKNARAYFSERDQVL